VTGEQRHGSAAHPGALLLARQVFPTARPTRAATVSYWSCGTPTRLIRRSARPGGRSVWPRGPRWTGGSVCVPVHDAGGPAAL